MELGKVTSVFLILFFASFAQSAHVCHNIECPDMDGFYPHPIDCNKYVKCIDGKAHTEICPANLHFNPLIGMCDHKENVKCNEDKDGSCRLGRKITTRLIAIPEIDCDCGKCCRKPDQYNCSAFYECDEYGKAHHKICPSGLIYNPIDEECDLPKNYKCPEIPTCNCKCRYPVEGECSAYYKCDDDHHAHKEYCSEGLFYNPENEMCDLPNNVDCGEEVTEEPIIIPEQCEDYKSDCKFWANNGDCTCRPFYNGDCSWQHYVRKNCPKSCKVDVCGGEISEPEKPDIGTGIDNCVIDCKLGQYHRHPYDCTKFIQCAPYGPQEMPCGPGTRWDQDILTCNHASTTECVTGKYPGKDGATCGNGTESVKPKPTTAKPTTVKTTTMKTTQPPPTNPGIDNCIINCELGQYHRHPYDCTKFIQCAPYGPQEMPCGAGTRWDQDILTCNHASTTECITGKYPGKDGATCGNGTESVKPQPSTVKPTEPKPTAYPDSCIKCPEANGLYPHPSNCNKWVNCANNIPYVKDCPGNLEFNPVLLVCDWPANAGCISSPDFECQIPKPILPECGSNSTAGICGDCDCCHVPHPTDCASYYFCHKGCAEFHTCSEGLVFNPDLDTCVLAETYPECEIETPPVCECDCFYPSSSCTEYYKCVDNVPDKRECEGGLYWNQNTKSCDYPQNVNCKQLSTRTLTIKTVAPIKAEDCANKPDGRYPSDDPQAYFQCRRGVAFLIRCKGSYDSISRKCLIAM